MGRMLAQFHMTARNDARDIEVVLGANITNVFDPRRHREPRVWVIDFNLLISLKIRSLCSLMDFL
jgi:hypothetical protein